MSKNSSNIPIVIWVLILSCLWWLLVGNDPVAWVVGVPSIFLAVYIKRFLPPISAKSPDLLEIIPFSMFFLYESLLSGWDVIKRAFHPDCPLKPGLIRFPLRLSSDMSQIFFANAISLLPGTLSATFEDGQLIVHVLDTDMPVLESLLSLENRIARLFREDLA